MQKKFVTNLAFLLFLNLLIKPFWILGIDRAIQNTVGAFSYGTYAALFNFSFLFNILLDLGITNYNNRNIARHSHLLQKHLSGIIVLRLLLAVFFFCISFTTGWFLGYSAYQLSLLCVLLLNQGLISFILYLRSNIAGLQLFKTDSMISVLDRLIMIVICAVLLWGHVINEPFKIEWFVWAQTTAYLITILITFLIVSSKANLSKLSWNPHFYIVILRKSLPFAVLILLMTFYNRIDSVMLERLLPDGAEQAGIYAQAYRLLDAANMIAFLFSGLLLPMFSHMIKHKQPLEDLVELATSFIAVPAIIVISFSVFFSNELMGLLYHAHVDESAQVYAIIMSCFLAISSVYIFGTLLTANGNLKQLNYVAFAGMIMNIALNFYLIPKYKALGAAIASLLTQYILAGAQIWLAHGIFKFHYKWWLFIRYAVFFVLSFVLFAYVHSYTGHWLIKSGIAMVICVGFALILKLIKPIALVRLIRSEEK